MEVLSLFRLAGCTKTNIALFRNNLLLESSFLMVEREEEDGSWTVVAVDSGTMYYIWGST